MCAGFFSSTLNSEKSRVTAWSPRSDPFRFGGNTSSACPAENSVNATRFRTRIKTEPKTIHKNMENKHVLQTKLPYIRIPNLSIKNDILMFFLRILPIFILHFLFIMIYFICLSRTYAPNREKRIRRCLSSELSRSSEISIDRTDPVIQEWIKWI